MSRYQPGSLTIVGTGIRAGAQLTAEAMSHMRNADILLYAVSDPLTERLVIALNARHESLTVFYGEGKLRVDTYEQMINRILTCLREGMRTCVAFYGHPGVFVYPSHESVARARAEGFGAVMLPGISTESCLFADLGVDPGMNGCFSYEATDFVVSRREIDPRSAVIIWQPDCVGDFGYSYQGFDGRHVPVLVESLLRFYDGAHEAVLYRAPFLPCAHPVIHRVHLGELADALQSARGMSTLYIPPAAPSIPDPEMLDCLELRLADLREQHGHA